MTTSLYSLMARLFFEHALLYGGYDTPATLAWDVESDATGLVLS